MSPSSAFVTRLSIYLHFITSHLHRQEEPIFGSLGIASPPRHVTDQHLCHLSSPVIISRHLSPPRIITRHLRPLSPFTTERRLLSCYTLLHHHVTDNIIITRCYQTPQQTYHCSPPVLTTHRKLPTFHIIVPNRPFPTAIIQQHSPLPNVRRSHNNTHYQQIFSNHPLPLITREH
jgi:hypothetical protein